MRSSSSKIGWRAFGPTDWTFL